MEKEGRTASAQRQVLADYVERFADALAKDTTPATFNPWNFGLDRAALKRLKSPIEARLAK